MSITFQENELKVLIKIGSLDIHNDKIFFVAMSIVMSCMPSKWQCINGLLIDQKMVSHLEN